MTHFYVLFWPPPCVIFIWLFISKSILKSLCFKKDKKLHEPLCWPLPPRMSMAEWMINYFCGEVCQFRVKSIFNVTRDGSFTSPDVSDHHEDCRPQRHRHHHVVKAEPISNVFLRKKNSKLKKKTIIFLFDGKCSFINNNQLSMQA